MVNPLSMRNAAHYSPSNSNNDSDACPSYDKLMDEIPRYQDDMHKVQQESIQSTISKLEGMITTEKAITANLEMQIGYMQGHIDRLEDFIREVSTTHGLDVLAYADVCSGRLWRTQFPFQSVAFLTKPAIKSWNMFLPNLGRLLWISSPVRGSHITYSISSRVSSIDHHNKP